LPTARGLARASWGGIEHGMARDCQGAARRTK
jgi:hypothetical protein